MDSIVQTFLNKSKLEVTLIRITQPAPNTYTMAIESRVTGTGPLGATMSPLTVEMLGPGGVFGKLDLPEVKTSSSGTAVNIPDQLIHITDLDAFKAFVKSLMLDQELTLRLENGMGTIRALMMTSNIVYKKVVEMHGMNGPKTEIISTVPNAADGTFTNTIKVVNPSPVEIDLGTSVYEFRDAKGEVWAEQRGKMYLMRGENEFKMTGKIIKKGVPEGKVRLVGVGVEEENWLRETTRYIDNEVELTAEMVELMKV